MAIAGEIPLDEVVYFDVITSNPATSAVSDADSTPTFDVYEEATDTGLLGATNFTKRTSLTGDYRGTFTASAANGFEVGKWYSVIASATVNSVAGKAVAGSFRLVAAEVSTGYRTVDIAQCGGSTVAAGAIPNAAGGAAGGLLILGANDAGSGMSISATSSGSGLIISGNGLKAGLRLIGGTGGAGASFESGGGNNPGAVFTRTGSGDDISLANSVSTTLAAAIGVPTNFSTLSITAGGVVSSQLADAVTHGGSSAMLQLGTSSSTPALKISGSAIAGETVRIESTGIGGVGANIVTTNTSGNALKVTSTGDAFTVASSAGKGLVLNTLGNGIDITTSAIGNGVRIVPGISGVAIATGSAGTGHGLQIAGSVDGINVAGGSDDIKLVNSDAPTLRDAITKTAFTESYAADGAAPTLEQILFLIQQMLCEKGIVGTTLTVKKLDGSTTAATFTLDSATTPTAITRST